MEGRKMTKPRPDWDILLREQCLCFTGHRPEKLPKGEALEHLRAALHYWIDYAVSIGFTHFVTGMADGIDYYAGEYLMTLKQTHPELKLIGVEPCKDYTQFFQQSGKYSLERLETLRQGVDMIEVLPGTCRDRDCFRRRNLYMVDHCGALIAVFSNPRSGSAQTYRYAQKCRRSICHLHPNPPGAAFLSPEEWDVETIAF